jgi:hypothetical protein
MEEVLLSPDKSDGQIFDEMKVLADKYGLWAEVREAYDRYRAGGDSAHEAAWCALYDWDCLPIDLILHKKT